MSVNALDGSVGRILLKPDKFEQADLGNCKLFSATGDYQGRNDRQRERDLDRQLGPFSLFGAKANGSADVLDVGFDDVHTYSAAGEVGYLFSCGKTWQKYEI